MAEEQPVSPTEAWWTRNDLNPSEQLWAVTLVETVLPRLGSGIWDPLPKPSTVRVPPVPLTPRRRPGSPLQSPPSPHLPISSRPPAVEHPSPAGPRVTPSHGGGEIQVPETCGAAAPPHRRKEEDRYSEPPVTRKEAAGVGRESAAEKTQRGSEDLAKRQISTFPLWSGPTTITTTTTAKKARLGNGGADRTETTMQAGQRVVERELEDHLELGERAAARVMVVEEEEEEEKDSKCCPIVHSSVPKEDSPRKHLRALEAHGFSQMECDSHLAQCLSDMNVDMAW
ncbi:LOW QUALITY PROTEIN: hypothetical protein CRUP_008452 [Coryphaenoides rupestris]|nr:LOW QUALITY PROTEIN: hypothetical protein CRUP_008452 [Coryphaenoides rupestris]